MRKFVAIMAATCLFGLASPAGAATYYNLSISGFLTGSSNTLMCNSGSAPGCLTAYPSGFATSAYAAEFTRSLGPLELQEGENNFGYGNPRSIGYFSGTIINQGGFLTGKNLSFYYEDSNLRFNVIGSSYISAQASQFNVVGGIPEPGTWALMLIGFGAVGTALRRAPRRTLQPA
ncbi:PEPxxWA-CTERM sorting domain-containing protein [Sphingomonas sp. LHG3443-2]|uniref:PEPxxWA-CTERM sorting domain-containing protein n=1 Tax=Sphingomonas sp. LHG3443-2 TaxID=2804639 RepID=UPI003CF7F0AB